MKTMKLLIAFLLLSVTAFSQDQEIGFDLQGGNLVLKKTINGVTKTYTFPERNIIVSDSSDLGGKANTSDLTLKADAALNASYRRVESSNGSHIAARVAGTYWLPTGGAAGITGTGTLYPPNIIWINAADFPTVNGVTPKLRLRAQIYCNDVTAGGTYTFALYPLTRPTTSGGAGLNIYTMGALVTGSNIAALTPVADGIFQNVSADFAVPATGSYVIGFVSSAVVATSSHLHIIATLQMRNN